jgi:hypothetical protein
LAWNQGSESQSLFGSCFFGSWFFSFDWRTWADSADKSDAALLCAAVFLARQQAGSGRFYMLARHFQHLFALLAVLFCTATSGCALWPDRVLEPQFHNPFPQIYRVAVLPFFNQSAEPTVDGDAVAIAYYNELQTIPGFEVMPLGVSKQMLAASIASSGKEPRGGADFQRLARQMGVDAVLVGSITEFTPYYPPRMGLAVDWYAANPSFHPIPAGYGLPWGRAEEEFIPSTLVQEAEFALAREQLKTQTPEVPPEVLAAGKIAPASHASQTFLSAKKTNSATSNTQVQQANNSPNTLATTSGIAGDGASGAAPTLPLDWPDPRGFVPAPPCAERPLPRVQHAPIMSHTRIYHGHDAKFTERLATYYYLRDDARFGGWPAYLERPEDFIRFCCYLHVTETLAARGGTGEARVLYRWPIRRYER